MVTQAPQLFSQITVIGSANACLAVSAQIFAVVQAETANIAQATHPLAVIRRAMRL